MIKGEPRHPIKMVAIDLDGTLIHKSQVHASCVKALREVQKNGVKVILASARPPRTCLEIHKMLRLTTPLVCYNGAVVYQPTDNDDGQNPGHVLMHQPLRAAVAQVAYAKAQEICSDLSVSVEVLDSWHTTGYDERFPLATAETHTPDYTGDLQNILQEDVTKLLLMCPPQDMPALQKEIQKVVTGHARLAVSDKHLLQVISPGADKSLALSWVTGRMGIKPENVMAIGDAPNDAAMLRWAGFGVAMGNAWECTKDAADWQTFDVTQGGVAHALEKWVLQTL